MKKNNLFICSLVDILDCAEKEKNAILDGKESLWNLEHHPLRVPKGWHGDFAACGQRSGLLALNLASIFEKLLEQKTFVCLRLVSCNQTSFLQ